MLFKLHERCALSVSFSFARTRRRSQGGAGANTYRLYCQRWICRYIPIHIPVYFYQRTLRGLQNRISHTRLQYEVSDIREIYGVGTRPFPCPRRGGAPRARVRSLRPSGDVCADPCAPKFRRDPEAFHLWGTGPSRTESIWGVASVGTTGPDEVP